MILEVKWTNEANQTFDNIVNLLEQKWNFRVSSDFVKSVQRVIKLIALQPYMFIEAAIILFFYDNRQDPLF